MDVSKTLRKQNRNRKISGKGKRKKEEQKS